MRSPDFVHEIEVPIVRSALHAQLGDLHQLRHLHPLIESIEDLPVVRGLPNARHYRVVDAIPLGPFRFRAVYTAALDPVSDSEIRGYAWQRPGVHLETIYTMHERGDGTRLREEVFVNAPFGLRGYVISKARSAHREMLDGLARTAAVDHE